MEESELDKMCLPLIITPTHPNSHKIIGHNHFNIIKTTVTEADYDSPESSTQEIKKNDKTKMTNH